MQCVGRPAADGRLDTEGFIRQSMRLTTEECREISKLQNDLDDQAGAALRGCTPEVQELVIERGVAGVPYTSVVNLLNSTHNLFLEA
eukprot:4441516-Amphidinium_carterae.1